jgi:predicted MPP superfamily phosphohydrolase
MMFFVTFLAVYVLINAYVYFRGFASLSETGWWVVCLKCLFAALAVAFPVMHALEDGRHGVFLTIADLIGSFWIVAMVYLFLIVLLSDIVKLADRVFPVIPARLKADPRRTGRAAFFGAVGLVILVVFFGWLNTRFVRQETITVGLPMLPKANNPTTVVFASDLHIGPTVHERRVETFVREINAAGPDIILLGGDLVEGSVAGLEPMAGILSRLHAPLGVYAVPGNHEYHGGADRAEAFMESAGITVLRDEVVTVPGIVNIIGLDDARAGNRKVSVADLIARCDPSLPTILLTHRPVDLEEYAADGIDLVLAGHSHHGQFFPLTIITDLVYTVSYGYARIGPMQVYVTSGLGTWGPPVRVLTHPEVVRITLESGPGGQ